MNSFIDWMYSFFYTTLSFICYTWQIYFFTLLLTLISPVFIRLHNNNNPWSKTSYHKLSCDFSLKCKQYFSILKHCYATRFISKTRASVGVAGFYLIIEGLAINKSKQLHFLRCHNPCPAHYFKVKPAPLAFSASFTNVKAHNLIFSKSCNLSYSSKEGLIWFNFQQDEISWTLTLLRTLCSGISTTTCRQLYPIKQQ